MASSHPSVLEEEAEEEDMESEQEEEKSESDKPNEFYLECIETYSTFMHDLLNFKNKCNKFKLCFHCLRKVSGHNQKRAKKIYKKASNA